MADWYEQALNAGQGFKSEEEKLKYFEDIGDPLCHPMFASDTEELARHPLVEAIRAIKEEGKTLLELSVMYKDEGNEWMKKKTPKDTREAFDRYAVGIGYAEKALAQNDSSEYADIYAVLSQLYANRSMCSLGLKNYHAAFVDACKALQFNSGNVKAHFRKCKALQGSKKFEECIKHCDIALRIDSENVEILKLREQSVVELERMAVAESQRDARRADLVRGLEFAWDIAGRRHAVLGLPRASHPEQLEGNIFPRFTTALVNDGEGRESEAVVDVFPMLCLYPQYHQIDVLQAVSPDELLVSVLAQMFAEPGEGELAPWDFYKEYYLSRLVVYIPIRQNDVPPGRDSWIKEMCALISKDPVKKPSAGSSSELAWAEVHVGCTVAQMLAAPGHVLDGGLLTITVFVRGNDAHTIFLERSRKEGVSIENLSPGRP